MQEQLNFDDIFGLWELSWWQKPWVLFLVVAGCAFVIFLIFYCVKRYCARSIAIDPRERAIRQLELIKPTRPFDTQEEYKNFYVTLFFILKEYFDTRYKLSCSSKTDRELVLYASQQYKIIQHQELIQTLVDNSVGIKFAKDNSTFDRSRADYQMVLDLFLQEPDPKNSTTPS